MEVEKGTLGGRERYGVESEIGGVEEGEGCVCPWWGRRGVHDRVIGDDTVLEVGNWNLE
jgi:hypothetical protein